MMMAGKHAMTAASQYRAPKAVDEDNGDETALQHKMTTFAHPNSGRRQRKRKVNPSLLLLGALSIVVLLTILRQHPVASRAIQEQGGAFNHPDSPYGGTDYRRNLNTIGGSSTELRIRPMFGSHRGDADAVFGMATGQQLVDFVRFVRSLVLSGFDGDIVLGVDPREMLEKEVQDFLLYHAQHHHLVAYEILLDCIQPYRSGWFYCQVRNLFVSRFTGEFVKDARAHRHLSQLRFDYFWAWSTQYSSQSRIMLLDARDLYVQRNPFPLLPSNTKLQSKLIVFAESDLLLIGNERYNRAWMRRAYGGEVWERLSNKLILCAGTTAGGQPAMEAYTRTMITQLDTTNCTQHGCDQGHHNYLVWDGVLERLPEIDSVQVQRQGEGLVNTLALLYWHGGHSLRSKGIIDNTTGAILNNDGSVTPVVHQFDRDPELVAIVDTQTKHYLEEWESFVATGKL